MPRRLLLAALVLSPMLALGFVWSSEDEEDLADQLPRLQPTEPADALETFQILDGFQLDPVAVEPIVTDPVDVCFDADGRLYVVEMRGYPFPQDTPAGLISLLEDTNDDGKYDKRTVFLDDLSWPTGIVPSDGGVFIAMAPDIRYAKDTNGDGKADVNKVMFTGFGNDNVQALLNGLIWGPDGWIYGAGSSNGGSIRNLSRPDDPPLELGRRDFRFKPDGSAFEALSGGGQFGHTFDDWYRRFTCGNSNHLRQVVLPSHYLARNPNFAAPAPTVDIAIDGGAAPVFRISEPEPWRVVRTRQRAADPEFRNRLPESELVVTGFFTSATGLTIYRGTAYPEAYQGLAFVGDVGGNLIHRKVLEPVGAIFQGKRLDDGIEFVASTDNWFRPVHFKNTPDGTLLVLDMYRETIEHPWSIPEPIIKHLDMMSGHDRGRLYHLIPEGFEPRPRPALSQADTAELVALLADPDAWWRETAQRLLIERRDDAAPPLLRALTAERPNPLGRMHALWTLDALDALRPDDILPALSDETAQVRERSAILAEAFVNEHSEIRDALLTLATDPDAMVRFQAAFSIGELDHDHDSAVVAALAEIVDRDAHDRWTRAAVLSSLSGRADQLIATLADRPGFLDRSEGRAWLGDLADLVGASKDEQTMQRVLERFASGDPAITRTVVLGLGQGLRRSGGSLREWVNGPAADVLAPVFAQAAEVVTVDGPPQGKIEAIDLLGLAPAEVALSALPGLLEARQPSTVQLAALRALGGFSSQQVSPTILGAWRALTPAARREAAEVLFARPDRINALLDALESGALPPADLDPARRQQLLEHSNESIRSRSVALLANVSAQSDRAEVIATYQKALDLDPNPTRGREVFRNVCATCHQAEEEGIEVGPDLATVAHRDADDLLIHILDPNREVLPAYLNYTIATTDGRVLSGQIANESANAVTLKRAEGLTDVIPRDQIEEMASTGLSLMPDGLEEDIDPQAMADLIAFLQQLDAAE